MFRLVRRLGPLKPTTLLKSRFYSGAQPKPPNTDILIKSLIFTAGSIVGGYLYSSEVQQSTKSTLPIDQVTSPEYANKEQLAQAIEAVKKVFRKNTPDYDESLIINSSQEDKDSHSDTYFNSYHPEPNEEPQYVIYPRSTEEVSEVLKICNKYKVPVVPITGKSSLEGHFINTRRGVCIDISLMDEVIELNQQDLDIKVQAGLGWETLADYLSEYNLLFPIDPGPGASIGGICANNASGTNASRYGECYKNVLSLTVVLADGTIIKTKNRPRKSSAGYNLNSLFIGSEGTLGIITEATLKLYVKPKIERVAVVPFKSIQDAANSVNSYLLNGMQLNAIELLDDKMMSCINASGETSRKWTEAPTLFLKIGGSNDKVVQSTVDQVKTLSSQHNSIDFQFARNDEETEELWSARKVALWSTINQGRVTDPSIKLWTTDAAVPISKLPQFLEETKEDIANNGLENTLVAHIGDGNAHSFILYKPDQYKLAEKVVDNMVRRAIAYEGTCTGEHGVGLGKRQFLLEEVGGDAVDLMRNIKLHLDPSRILNPDKIFQIDPKESRSH
ncbi:D-lactate dehydrogenase [cytochrome] 1, mitochondrial [[Candida] jaroonii]|uniref:D-lactate dehydrogenase [cytochrome] 1, mitochondrial n=1 Tax=[Candida] jaroonii TaxID=467808 RepID=A0ACA9YBG9_9ASCO|nr:D-lactate dehydrogenase [cytochrome] 1, mitochondrial [[Candida] jaroonii]